MMSKRTRAREILVAAAFVATLGCDNGRAMHPDASSLFTCTSNADCDDHIACTADSCGVGAVCSHAPIDSMCTSPEHCMVGVGCTSTTSCMDSTMCDDGVGCTLDTCNVGGVCGHQPIQTNCSAPTPVCDPVRDCVAGTAPGCASASECDDGVACTVDSCAADMTCHHTPIDTMCMASERCDVAMGCQAYHGCSSPADCTPVGQTWWNFCDGDPACQTEFGCSFPSPRVCHDSDPCTIDSCDRTMGANGACVFACDSSRPECGCPMAGPTCAGNFQVTPAPTGMCAFGAVRWNLSTMQINNMDGALTITVPQLSSSGSLDTGSSTMTCPTFTATRNIPGGCIEDYTITATFSDDDHLNGTFTANFTPNTMGCLGCTFHSYTFTATRIP